MKKLISLLVFTACIATAGWANNTPEPNGDPEQKKNEGEYTFSLSTSYFSIFNIFTVHTTESDSLRSEEVILPKEEDFYFDLIPIWP